MTQGDRIRNLERAVAILLVYLGEYGDKCAAAEALHAENLDYIIQANNATQEAECPWCLNASRAKGSNVECPRCCDKNGRKRTP